MSQKIKSKHSGDNYTSGLQYMLPQANYQNQDIYHSLSGKHQNFFCSYYFRGQMDDILQKNITELNKRHKNALAH